MMPFIYPEKDSDHGKDLFVTDLIVERDLKHDDYEEYTTDRALRELGYEFAKRYAGKRIMWQYQNLKTGQMEYFTKLQDKPYLKLFAKELTFILKANNG